VRVETAPGAQLQIDFKGKRVVIGDTAKRVFLLVAVLSYSRRLVVKAFLQERQDDWREASRPRSSPPRRRHDDAPRRQCGGASAWA
jgi:transposase